MRSALRNGRGHRPCQLGCPRHKQSPAHGDEAKGTGLVDRFHLVQTEALQQHKLLIVGTSGELLRSTLPALCLLPHGCARLAVSGEHNRAM